MTRTTVRPPSWRASPMWPCRTCGRDRTLPHHRRACPAVAARADGACGINSCVTDLAKWDAMWANRG
ncbi:MAG: hypothetical protein IPN38_05395 [Flavobacteriales bacterium]|nr:hypothetical protein [Flavobacteriales bacterium]